MNAPRLKKRLGQHHLIRAELARPLNRFLEPAGRTVLEVGPGGGVLTGLLLESGARVVGVELDPAWAFALTSSLPAMGGRTAVADALGLAWRRLPQGTLVAGNLPYEIAATLIADLLRLGDRIERMGFLVQLEVARRLTAGAGDEDYGALSVLVRAYADARILGRLAPGSFRPPPKVNSAFVGLVTKPPPLAESEMDAFVAMVRLGFGQRRKTLRNALAAGWGRERAEAALAAASIAPRARAEELALEEFLTIYRADPGRSP